MIGPSGQPSRRRSTGPVTRAWLVLLILALAACDSTPSPSPSATPAPEPTATTTTYQLNTTVWYAGLVLTFESATAVLDQRGGPVSVLLQLENPGSEDQTLDSPIHLVAGGTPYEPARETVLPSVPAAGMSFTTLKFNVFDLTSVDGAVLQIGAPDRHQAVVPFTTGAVAPVVLKPTALTFKGATTASDLHLVLSGGLLRWDLPDWAEELPATSAALTLSYAVTYTGTFSGGVPFTSDNIRLSLPNGQVVAPRADGRSQSVAAIMPGQTLRGLFSRFEIPANLPGRYALLLVENGKTSRIVITLPG